MDDKYPLTKEFYGKQYEELKAENRRLMDALYVLANMSSTVSHKAMMATLGTDLKAPPPLGDTTSTW